MNLIEKECSEQDAFIIIKTIEKKSPKCPKCGRKLLDNESELCRYCSEEEKSAAPEEDLQKPTEKSINKSKQEYCEMCGKPITSVSNRYYPCCSRKCEQAALEPNAKPYNENEKQCPFCTQKSLEEVKLELGDPAILQCMACGYRCSKTQTIKDQQDSWKKPKRLTKAEEKQPQW